MRKVLRSILALRFVFFQQVLAASGACAAGPDPRACLLVLAHSGTQGEKKSILSAADMHPPFRVSQTSVRCV